MSKLKKFCRLSKFLEQEDKKLYNVMDDLCILYVLKPNRNAGGVTFLYPKEKAYRQKIINAAYSENPEVAVNMIKSLVLFGYYADVSDFSGDVVNLLNQKVEFESTKGTSAKLKNGLKLEKNKKFSPMSYRENMAVYDLSGKGEIPVDSKVVSIEQKKGGKKRYGGGSAKDCRKFQDLLAQKFINEDGANLSNNIYMKKVYIQLGALIRRAGNDPKSESYSGFDQKLVEFLGNDEFSDSYLLDIYCSKYCSEVLNEVYKCIKSIETNPTCREKLANVSLKDYLSRKEKVCVALTGSKTANANVEERNFSKVRRGVSSPADIRTKVKSLYKSAGKMSQLSRDLYLVFVAISKVAWKRDPSAFDTFHCCSSRIYNNLERIVNVEFDIARDLSLWGNLLKSDALLYKPQAFFDTLPVDYPAKESMPDPKIIESFSLNALVEKWRMGSGVSGGFDIKEISALESLL